MWAFEIEVPHLGFKGTIGDGDCGQFHAGFRCSTWGAKVVLGGYRGEAIFQDTFRYDFRGYSGSLTGGFLKGRFHKAYWKSFG